MVPFSDNYKVVVVRTIMVFIFQIMEAGFLSWARNRSSAWNITCFLFSTTKPRGQLLLKNLS